MSLSKHEVVFPSFYEGDATLWFESEDHLENKSESPKLTNIFDTLHLLNTSPIWS